MKNLFKYEMRKTLIAKLILAAIAAIVEALFLVGLFKNRTGQQTITMVVFILLGLVGVLLIGIQSIVALHRDMNTRQGYMLFMTPNSSYKILGAKVLENACSILIASAVFFEVCVMDYSLMVSHSQDVSEVVDILKQIVNSMGASLSFNVADIASFVLNYVMQWLCEITVAFFADILISSVLNGKKFAGLLGFALFLLFSYAVGEIAKLLPEGGSLPVTYAISTVYYAVIVALTYFGSAKLMDRHLSI